MSDWPPTFPAGTLVWCPDCDDKQELVIVENDASSVDILCDVCRVVLLTLFRAQ